MHDSSKKNYRVFFSNYASIKITSITPPFKYTSALGNSEAWMCRPNLCQTHPQILLSVSPNEAAEVALDLDYKQEIQSRIKKEGTMCPLCLTGHRVWYFHINPLPPPNFNSFIHRKHSLLMSFITMTKQDHLYNPCWASLLDLMVWKGYQGCQNTYIVKHPALTVLTGYCTKSNLIIEKMN